MSGWNYNEPTKKEEYARWNITKQSKLAGAASSFFKEMAVGNLFIFNSITDEGHSRGAYNLLRDIFRIFFLDDEIPIISIHHNWW
jgi:hypothetical protein